jgi:D,D-heptose 1,7-bisphosphate phosphatase
MTRCTQAVILAGGRGTRLGGLARDVPKALVPVCGKPVLEYQVDSLRRSGIADILLVTGHLGDRIEQHFGDGSDHGVRIRYAREASPLGTAGALAELWPRLAEPFLLLYGDLVLDLDFGRLLRFHAGHPGTASVLVHPNDHPADSDLVVLGPGDVVLRLVPKNEPRRGWFRNLVSAGVLACDPGLLAHLRPGRVADLERDVLGPAIRRGEAYGYRTTEYVKDMGTPARHALVSEHAARGVVARRNLARSQKAVFLDRDGTVNEHVGLLSRPADLRVPDQVYASLAALNSSEYLAIVVTNQPVVARNLCTMDGLELIHRRLDALLGERNVYLDDLYYCPHHPDSGYPEENPAYKVNCDCRKPKTGLIRKAAQDYNLDLSESYLVGDTTVDVQTGRNAALRTVLLATGERGADRKHDVAPDFHASDLASAVDLILAN